MPRPFPLPHVPPTLPAHSPCFCCHPRPFSQQEPTPPAAPHLHQPACTVPKPVRSEAAPPSASTATAAGSLGSSPRGGAASSCLDQYHSMLPDNPVQQLPLLPTTASHTSATVRVAAWLLGGGDAAGDTQQEAAAAEEDAAGCTASSDAASLAGCSDVALLDELEQARYGPGGDTRASAAQAPAQHLGKAGSDVDGYRATSYYCQASRRSLDGFMSRPVQVRLGGVRRRCLHDGASWRVEAARRRQLAALGGAQACWHLLASTRAGACRCCSILPPCPAPGLEPTQSRLAAAPSRLPVQHSDVLNNYVAAMY